MNTKRRADCQLRNDWKERIIRIGDEQTSLQNQFDNLRNDFSDNSPRIEALETDVNALDGRLIIAESDIAAAENRISACENDIDRIDAELVDKTGDINALANRMSLAETDIDSIDARVSGIETGEILLSQLVVDADKDMGGKTLSNVNLNKLLIDNISVNGDRVNSLKTIFDCQPYIENELIHNQASHDISYEQDLDAPFSKFIRTIGYTSFGASSRPFPAVNVHYNTTIYVTGWARTASDAPVNSTIRFYCYQKNTDGTNSTIPSNFVTNVANDGQWHRIFGSFTMETNRLPVILPYILINYNLSGSETNQTDICGIRYFVATPHDEIIDGTITTNGVIIADGGTVDGVDVSAHTHDGSAVGGAKINLANVEVTNDKDMGGFGFSNLIRLHLNGEYPMRFAYPGRQSYLLQLFSTNISIMPSVSLDGTDWDLSKAVRIYANGTKEINGPLTNVTSVNGATINAAKAAEWDGKARPPAYKRYYNPNLTTPTTEYLEPSAGRSAFIPMKISAEAEDGNGNVAIYAIFDDSSELLLGRASSPMNGFSLTADQIAQKLGDGNKSGRTITRFKIMQEMAGVGKARIDAYEY